MKKIGKVLIGIVGVFVLAIVAIFLLTSDMVKTADEFFVAVKSKDMEGAYSYLSEDFKSGVSKSELESFLSENSLTEFREASWSSRSRSGGRGSLVGSVTTESGGVVPITLGFVKGDSGWRIYSIQKPSSGIKEESSNTEIPTEEEQVKMVASSMQVFAECVNEKSMSKLHAYASNLLQQQFTIGQLNEAYGAFYELSVDFTVLKNHSPKFEQKSTIDEDGVLTIAGQYPTKPNSVHFEQTYIFEGLGWKLLGFNINVK